MNVNAAALIRNALNAPAMRFRNFRFLSLSAVFDAMGFMGEQVALGWIVLQLTGSPLMVGAALGARAAPFFFLGLVAGAVADIVDRRNLMLVLNVGLAAVTSTIGVLLLLDALEVWHLFLFGVVGGSLTALYQTSRQSFVYDVVGPGNLVSGLAYVSLGMRIGGLIGSLGVGFLIGAQGPWAAYMLLAAAYLTSAAALSLISGARSQGAEVGEQGVVSLTPGPQPPTPRRSQPVARGLKELGGELRRNNALLVLVVMVAAAEMLGFSSAALLPSLARDVLNVGSEGLGILNAARSVGAIIAILMLSPFGEIGRKGPLLVVALVIFGGAVALLGVAPTFLVAVVAVGVIGGMMAMSDLFSQSLMQNIVPNALRGRAMGAWVVAVGTAPVGNLQMGALAAALGVTFALLANGAALAVVAVAAILLYPRLRKL